MAGTNFGGASQECNRRRLGTERSSLGVPPGVLARLVEQEPQCYGSDWGQELFASDLSLTQKMHKSGVMLLAGTDTPNPSILPRFALHDELKLLVSAGFSPMEAIQAATLNPARYLGREKDLGTIETGKLADLVLLDANPLDDISNTQKIRAVDQVLRWCRL
jgi:imidazolonepropionase-like amidohydrolase